MKPPLFVRALQPEERQALEQGLRSASGFEVRRCQVLLQSAQGATPRQIQEWVGLSDQSVRRIIRAFHREGLGCLEPKSRRPKTVRKVIGEEQLPRVKELLHRSPREFGLETSLWTLEGMAQVCAEQGITERLVSDETIRDAVKRLKVGWQRAKRWLQSPDPEYARKKGHATG